jgi:hypothetical protein
MRGACSTCGGRRGAFRILVVKLQGKRPPGRPRPRWYDNIKMYLQEVIIGIRKEDIEKDILPNAEAERGVEI